MPQRSSDITEQFAAKALGAGIGGVIVLLLGIILFVFRGDGALVGLAIVLLVGGVGLLGFAGYNLNEIKKVPVVKVECPYCRATNKLTSQPTGDFTCQECHRLIPIVDGKPIPVMQVRCGYCNALNFYSEKSEVLLCEDCNREISISIDDDRAPKHIAFARRDDDKMYELILVSHGGHKTEELIAALQHMLALNRNQVKQMLEELPVTLLSGIPRMKAEMLQTQLAANDAVAEFRPLG